MKIVGQLCKSLTKDHQSWKVRGWQGEDFSVYYLLATPLTHRAELGTVLLMWRQLSLLPLCQEAQRNNHHSRKKKWTRKIWQMLPQLAEAYREPAVRAVANTNTFCNWLPFKVIDFFGSTHRKYIRWSFMKVNPQKTASQGFTVSAWEDAQYLSIGFLGRLERPNCFVVYTYFAKASRISQPFTDLTLKRHWGRQVALLPLYRRITDTLKRLNHSLITMYQKIRKKKVQFWLQALS